MSSDSLAAALHARSRTFGKKAALQKLRLLQQITEAPKLSARDLVLLQDTLDFMRAYPDGPALRRQVLALIDTLRGRVAGVARGAESMVLRNRGFPGAIQAYSYHFGTLRQLVHAFPGRLEIDWERFEDDTPLLDALRLVVPPPEADGLDDERLSLEQWFARCRPEHTESDLEHVLQLLGKSGHDERIQIHLYDAGDVPIRYHLATPGSGRCEVALDVTRTHFQRREIERSHFPLAPLIREPLQRPRPLAPRAGRRLIHTALAALCSRNLEIYPLIYAHDRDVMRVRCARGIEVVLVGTHPIQRSALESIYFFLIVKNGVPIAYGPAGVFLGACEMGINLFPEFRGGEIRFIYAQLMRVLRAVLDVDLYFLKAYGMGEDNPDAIGSGAFWFYRKLGFAAANPRVESLAHEEEQRLRSQPGARSSTAMLRRLSHTEAVFDLSQGKARPFDFPGLGVALSRFVGREFGGDHPRATHSCLRRLKRSLPLAKLASWSAEERDSLTMLAPIIAMLPDLASWSGRDRAALVRAIRAKGGPSEAPAARALGRHPRFGPALRALVVGAGPPGHAVG